MSEVRGRGESMSEPGEQRFNLVVRGPLTESPWFADPIQHDTGIPHDDLYVPVRQAGGYESGNLQIQGIFIPVEQFEGIG